MTTSEKTAMARIRMSVPARTLQSHKKLYGRVLDYGCGRGRDARELDCEKWDPYWFPAIPSGKFDVILCTYVLNVIPKEEEQEVLDDIRERLRDGGVACITVRRDVEKDGPTPLGYQRNVELDLPVFAMVSGHYCTYVMTKS